MGFPSSLCRVTTVPIQGPTFPRQSRGERPCASLNVRFSPISCRKLQFCSRPAAGHSAGGVERALRVGRNQLFRAEPTTRPQGGPGRFVVQRVKSLCADTLVVRSRRSIPCGRMNWPARWRDVDTANNEDAGKGSRRGPRGGSYAKPVARGRTVT